MGTFDEKNTQSYDWDKDGVYVIEPADYVEGGEDGVSNRQAKELTKRTRNLHDRFKAHNGDNVRHITANERSAWSAKETPTGAQDKATTAKNEAIATSATDASTKSAAALQSAKEYANGKDTTLRNDMAVADTATLRTAKSYADTIVAALVDNSPEALNTLQELAKAMGNDPNFATTVMQAIGERAKTTDVNAALAAALQSAKTYTDTQISEVNSDLSTHNSNSVRHITSAERTAWNAKETPTGAQTKATTAKNEAIATSASDASTKSAAALLSAKEYANGKDSTLRTDMATADTATLRSAKSYADTIVAALVDNSPEALNTLQELAVALGNDPNFATTVMQAIGERAKTTDVTVALAGKAPTNHTHTAAQVGAVVNPSNRIRAFAYGTETALEFMDVNGDKGYVGKANSFAYIKNNNKYLKVCNDGGLRYGDSFDQNGEVVYHSGNFDPSTKLDKSGGVVTGATDFNTNRFAVGDNEWKMGLESSDMSNEGIVVLRDSAKTYISYLRVGRNKLQWHPTGTNTVVYDMYHTGNLVPATTAANGLMSAADKNKLESYTIVRGSVNADGSKSGGTGFTTYKSGNYLYVRHSLGYTNYMAVATVNGISNGSTQDNEITIISKTSDAVGFLITNGVSGEAEVAAFDFIIMSYW